MKEQQLPTPIQQEIQAFRGYLQNQTSSEDTIYNYTSSVRRYYKLNDLEKPINPSRFIYLKDKEDMDDGGDSVPLHRDFDELFKSIDTTITSRSMKYGVRKYYKYLKSQTSDRMTRLNLSEILEKLDNLEVNIESKDKQKHLTQGKVQSFINQADSKSREFGTLVKMMYETAARASGMTNLIWEDVDLDEDDGRKLDDTEVRLSKKRTKSKESGIVYISEDTYRRLEELREQRNPGQKDNVFFPDMTRGSLYNKIWRLFDGSQASPHSFRHSRLISFGVALHEEEGLAYESLLGKLSSYARHKDTETTKIYVEKVKDLIEDDQTKLKKYVGQDLKAVN